MPAHLTAHSLLLGILLTMAPASAQTPTTTSTPTPTTPPLKLIIRIRATVRCAQIAAHSNAAISSAIRGDQNLTTAVSALRDINLEPDTPSRTQGLHRLDAIGAAIARSSRNGDGEIKALRALIAKETDPVVKKQLLDFVNSLGGAIYRQKKVGRDLDGFVAGMYAKAMYHVDEDQEKMMIYTNGRRTFTPMQGTGSLSIDSAPDRLGGDPITRPLDALTDTMMARIAAGDYHHRAARITNDEATAAQAALVIANGC